MEQFEQLLSKFKDYSATELRLEANQKPHYITPSGIREISSFPIQHKDIVMLLSPILPATAKSELMERTGTEFTHKSQSGSFIVNVKKSNIGFNVTVRPVGNSGPIGNSTINNPVSSTPPLFPASSSGPLKPLNQSPSPPPASTRQPQAPTPPPASSARQTGQQSQAGVIAMPAPPGVTAPTTATPPPQVYAAPPSTSSAFQTSPNSLPMAKPAAEIDELFFRMSQMGASDLHLSVGMPPMVRHDGEMKALEGLAILKSEDTERLLYQIIPKRNRDEFERRHDTDFAYEIQGLARFRSNIFMDRKGVGAVFRVIPTKILTAEQLGLPKSILDLCFLSKGLVVVTGPTGSGKSTTLAAMIDFLNKGRKDHVITIEDPIEFVHENKGCLINQREVHSHTDSFKDALRAALREDPDIILVGEMRDLETIAIAIETAETGHLVFGTLHTTTAASTVDRLIDQFPADRQAQIRTMLSESLKGVIAQTLLKKKGGGRVAALEVLLVTPAISNLIREGKTFQIPSVMQTSKNIGMVTLNDALLEHIKSGIVSVEEAYVKAVDKIGFKELCKRNNIELSV